MYWKILDTGVAGAASIMQKDKEILDSLHLEKDPILHLYAFEGKAATYGHFLKTSEFFDLDKVEKAGLSLAKRPTGGGVIFHLWDLAFSAFVPSSHKAFSENTLENYATINLPILSAIEEFMQISGLELTPQDGEILGPGCAHFCMAKPTKYDVVFQGKKVAGAAQRKTRNGFLHQGSISLLMPSKEFLESVLLPGLSVLEGMFTYTFPLLAENASLDDLDEARREMQELIKKNLQRERL